MSYDAKYKTMMTVMIVMIITIEVIMAIMIFEMNAVFVDEVQYKYCI